jgi:hypothetical protein
MQAAIRSVGDHLDRAVFVAVVAVNEVQAAVHQVVHVPAVRHLRVVAVLAVPVTGLMPEFGRVRGMAPRAVGGVALADLNGVLLQRTVFPQKVQVTALEDVDVVLVPDADRDRCWAIGMPLGLVVVVRLERSRLPLVCHDCILRHSDAAPPAAIPFGTPIPCRVCEAGPEGRRLMNVYLSVDMEGITGIIIQDMLSQEA